MKKILLLLTLASSVNAGEVEMNEMYCDKTSYIFETLKKEHQEIPVVLGKADDIAKSTMSLWTNPKTNTWSIVATKDELSCIVGVGTELKIVNYNKKKSI